MVGKIIKEQRLLLKMSRSQLSKGICTEKYLYLIEKNERNPSAYILNSLSDRLGIDLFDYYQYLNDEDKKRVFKYRAEFERHIQNSDIKQLKEQSLKAAQLPTFQKEPLIYDIQVIDCTYRMIIEGETETVSNELNDLLTTKELNIDPITLVNAHTVLSTAYQIGGQWKQAQGTLEVAYNLIKNKKKFVRYNTVVISVLISITSLLYNMQNYEELIKYSYDLNEYQKMHGEFNRMYYVDFYLAFAYYHLNQPVKAREYFMRGGYSALLFKNRVDIEIILQMKDFKQLTEDLKIDEGFIQQLKNVLNSSDTNK